ncbi:TPA: hypothetical protein OV554_003585 [Acinetobacter baumannii]|nr:hypothetical protein [Acinetobacter baumannii]
MSSMKKKLGKGKIAEYSAYAMAVLCLVLSGVAYSYYSQYAEIKNVAVKLNEKYKDATTLKVDTDYDFLPYLCGKDAYCVTTETNNPSMEILKFLINFREIDNNQYRMFFEISLDKEKPEKQPEKLECNAGNSTFYLCQEISAVRPTDVLRNYVPSYKTLSKDHLYKFNLMIRPIDKTGELKDVMVLNPMFKGADPNQHLSPDQETTAPNLTTGQVATTPNTEAQTTQNPVQQPTSNGVQPENRN